MDYIKELYYDKLTMSDTSYMGDPEYSAYVKKLVDRESKLIQFFDSNATSVEKGWFKDLEDAQSDVSCYAQCEKFIEGFRLGTGIMLDTFVLPK